MIKKKIINHLTLHGNKTKSEKIFKESIKKIQKESKKPVKKIIQSAIVNSTPIFKVHKVSSKGRKKRKQKVIEIPFFIKNLNAKLSLSIKLILLSLKKIPTKMSNKIKNEILQILSKKGLAIRNKNELQKRALTKINNKQLYRYYRW